MLPCFARSVQCPGAEDQRLSVAIPVQGSSTLLLALLEKQICLVDRNTGGLLCPRTHVGNMQCYCEISGDVTEVLEKVEPDKPKNHTNDAKCDSSGRLWFGTMGNTTGPLDVDFGGGFYSYFNGKLSMKTSRGECWKCGLIL